MGDWAWIAASYVAGSVPFGLLIGLARGVDLREAGSGNIGATNAWRVLGRGWGLFCFVLDVLKGAIPMLAFGWRQGLLGRVDLPAMQAWWWLAVGAAAIGGHMFPVWLKFRGGKGVATGFGVMLGMWPVLTWPVLGGLAVWLCVVRASGYVSLASMAGAGVIPFVTAALLWCKGAELAPRYPLFVVTAALAVLVAARHRTNIARLRAGSEPKVGRHAQQEDSAD